MITNRRFGFQYHHACMGRKRGRRRNTRYAAADYKDIFHTAQPIWNTGLVKPNVCAKGISTSLDVIMDIRNIT